MNFKKLAQILLWGLMKSEIFIKKTLDAPFEFLARILDVAASIKKREDRLEQHAVFAHELRNAVRLMVGFANIYCELSVAQWLRCCTTTRKVAGSITASVIGIFH